VHSCRSQLLPFTPPNNVGIKSMIIYQQLEGLEPNELLDHPMSSLLSCCLPTRFAMLLTNPVIVWPVHNN
jgi:hypothetical protein